MSDDDDARPYTKDEVLHGVALLQAHLAGDQDAVAALHGDDDADSAVEAARAMYAMGHIIVYGLIVPEMWVIKKGFSYGETRHVPELQLAILMVERLADRVEMARDVPAVCALSAGDVMGLIVQCTGTTREEVPAFLNTVRERTLQSMTA
ncbi:DUF6224 family protein [Streptomyces celluloflavus]|uniref:DUF6224 family protein n=1 Tax=Streptomyces celluloflavus TaxID=58344 RepID=UPI00379EEAAE